MRLRACLALAAVCASLAVTSGCRRETGTPRIANVYPADRGGHRAVAVAQAIIDGWRTPRVAEVFVPDLASSKLSEVSRNVEYADRAIRAGRANAAVGHLGSRTSLVVAPQYTEAGVPLVVPTSTSRRLGELGTWVFPLAANEAAEGEFLVSYATGPLALKRLTVIYRSADEYGTGLRDAVIEALRSRNLTPVDQLGVLDDSDHDRLLEESLKHATPDGLILAVGPGTALAILRSVARRLPGLPVIAGDSLTISPKFIRDAGGMCENLHAVAFWHPDVPRSESRAFVEAYRREPGLPPPSSTDAMYFDGVMLLATAIRDAGAQGRDIQKYLQSLGTSRPPYQGVTGPISFQKGRPTNLLMTRVRDGVLALAPGR